MAHSTTSLVLFAALLGCSSSNAGDGADAGTGLTVDAPDGVGCTALTPRTVPLESFVGPTGLETRMLSLIDSAQSTLDIHMYLFTVKSIANKIVAAKQRGVAVRLLLDPDELGNNNVEPIFDAGGVTWKNTSSIYSYAHAKYVIVDKSQAAIMSMNWNLDAMSSERNYGIIDKDPEDLADLQAIFEQDWTLASGQAAAAPDLTCTRLIVSPTNSKQRILEHIASATSTLDVEALYVSDSNVRTAIVAAKQRGVTVRVIVSDPTDTAVAYFKTAGIPVKTPSGYLLHAKLIIADAVAFVGSENMSSTSLTKNREVGELAFEPAAVAPIQTQFNTDWTGSVTQ